MNRIRELRNGRKIKQSELADMLAITQATLSNWERGIHDPDSDSLLAMAEYFSASTDFILGRDELPFSTKNAPPQSRSAMENEIIERLEILSPAEQQEALGYLDFLVHRRSSDTKAP